jgi:hypothetical protein
LQQTTAIAVVEWQIAFGADCGIERIGVDVIWNAVIVVIEIGVVADAILFSFHCFLDT